MNFKRLLAFVLLLFLFAFVFHYMAFIRRYDLGYSYSTVSDSLFLVGVIGFFPSVMAQLGTYRFFYGFQYALRGLFSEEFRSKYRNLSDYLIDKKLEVQTTIYQEMIISSGFVLALSILIGSLWGRAL